MRERPAQFFVLHDHVGGDAGNHHDQRNEQLQETGEHHALLGFVQALGGQRALGDVLVEPPVAQVGDPHAADEHAEAGQHIVSVFGAALAVGDHKAFLQNHVEVVGRFLAEPQQTAQHVALAHNV